MNYEELTKKEQMSLTTFMNLLTDTGYSNNFIFFDKTSPKTNVTCIYKENDKWISNRCQKGKIIESNQYDDINSLCINSFLLLDKDSKKYCLTMYSIILEEIINKEDIKIKTK